jgi:hypothetical protein
MPTNRLIRSGPRVLRDVVTRAHLRADLLPRLPFAVAIVVAVVLMVVAIEHDPETDAATVAVEELPSGPPTFYEGEYYEEEADFEILEHGFGKVTDPDGRERIIVALIVHNPQDEELMPGGLLVHTETPAGYPITLEEIYLGIMPPKSTAKVGYVLYADVEDIEVEDLQLKTLEPSMVYGNREMEIDTDELYVPGPLPDVEFLGTEPLASPDGYRVHFRTESATAVADTQLSVLFRDGEGRLIGGLPASGEPLSDEGSVGGYRVVPEGESLQHFDLHESWIPEGADLDRIEVGPSH